MSSATGVADYAVENDPGTDSESRARNEPIPLEEAFRINFFFASVLGLHSVRKMLQTEEGREEMIYVFDRRSLIPKAIGSIIAFVWVVMANCFFSFYEVPLWFILILSPLTLCLLLCIFIYVHSNRNSCRMTLYMREVRKLTMERTNKPHLFLMTTVFYTVTLTVCSLLLLPFPQRVFAIFPILIATFTPAVMDIYIFCFVKLIVISMNQLHAEMKKMTSSLSVDLVRKFTARWLQLVNIMDYHNKIFSKITNMRLFVMVCQTMAYLFVLWGMRRVTYPCCNLLIITALPLFEVTGRLYILCRVADMLPVVNRQITMTATKALYSYPLDSTQHKALLSLVSRMEARPAVVENWGMERMSMRTFYSMMGLASLYGMILLQFASKDNWDFTPTTENELDYLHNYYTCFIGNTTTIDKIPKMISTLQSNIVSH